jgi:hypothetical protein
LAWAELLQNIQAGAKIDVIRLTVQHEGRDRFDASALGFGHSLFGLAEMDDFHFEASGIQCCGKVLFGGHADGTTGVIELGFGFHVRCIFCFVYYGVAVQTVRRMMKLTEVSPA